MFIDSHCHLDFDDFQVNFDEISIRDAIDEILGNQWERELAPFREVEIDQIIQLRAI